MTQPTDPDEGPLIYKIPEVCRLLNMSRRSVEVLMATGKLKSHKILGSRRISRAAVDELLRQTEEGGPEVVDDGRAPHPPAMDRSMPRSAARRARASV